MNIDMYVDADYEVNEEIGKSTTYFLINYQSGPIF